MVQKRKKSSPGIAAATAGAGTYISVKRAASLIGVTPESIRLWVRRGILPSRKFRVVQLQSMVLRSALESVRTVTCQHCGETFTARRPQKARFCCAQHRDQWNYQAKKVKAAKPRRGARIGNVAA